MAETTETLILDIQFDSAQAIKEATDLKNRIESLQNANKALKKEQGGVTDEYVKNQVEVKRLQKELQANEKALLSRAQLLKAEAGSNDALKLKLSLLTAQYNAMAKTQKEGTVAGESLKKAISDITEELSSGEKEVGNFRRGIGDYQGAAERASNSLQGMKERLAELNKVVQTSEVGSKQFKDAQDEAGKLGLAIGQVEGKLDEFGNKEPKNPAKKSFDDTVQAAGAAASAVQLSSLIFDENSVAAESLAKSVKALAIGQQVANIVKEKGAIIDTVAAASTGLAAGATTAYTVAVGTSTGALKAFRLALAATGIGAIIVALGLLIANFDAVSDAVRKFLGLASDEELASEKLKEAYKGQADQLGLLLSLEERRITTIGAIFDRQIALAKASGRDTTNIEAEKQKAYEKTTLQIIAQLEAQLKNAKAANVSAKEQISLAQQIEDKQNELADARNDIEVKRLEAIKKNKDEAIKASKEQADKNKAALEKQKADNEKAAADELKLQQELTKARLELLDDGANKEILIAQNAAAERIAAITGKGATAEALRVTIAQETEQQIAEIRAKYANEAIAKQQEIYDKEKQLQAERQQREADEFVRRQNAILEQANFEFAQQQLGISNEDAKFIKTVEGLNALVAIQQQTGQTRAQIDQDYYDFVERNGEISFEQFVDLQARQVEAQAAANQQLISAYSAFGSQVGDIFAQALDQQGGELKAFGRKFIILILDVLQKQVTAAIVSSTAQSFAQADSVASFGATGGIRAAILTAAIQGAFGLAKAKLSEQPKGFATGVVGLQGEGTSTSDSIPAWLSKGESVVTADGTNYAEQNFPGFLSFLNSKNKFATGVVNFQGSQSVADMSGFAVIADAISKMQPVVKVSDINKKQSDYSEVRVTGTI